MTSKQLIAPLVLVAVAVAGAALAQHSMHSHGSQAPESPRETGEAAFAALAEIVGRLDADPTTDWEKVSIRTLRDHLVDMHRLTLDAEVDEQLAAGGFTARITGEGATRAAIQRMVPAHGRMLAALGYEVEVATTGAGADLTVRVSGPEPASGQVARLRGLGFFGVMTLGDHHRPHHLGMARGEQVHAGSH